jgi:hypothetical protein
LILYISGGEVQNFTHPHTTPGHEFQHGSVSYPGSPEDYLIDGFFFQDLSMGKLPGPKKFPQHRGIAWIRKLGIEVVPDEVEEGFEVGITGVLN